MSLLWNVLYGTDPAELGCQGDMVESACADPLVFAEVMRVLAEPDMVEVRREAATVADAVTKVRPLFLTPYKRILLEKMSGVAEEAVRRHVAAMYSRIFWDAWEMTQAVTFLESWAAPENPPSVIVASLQTLSVLAGQKEWIQPHLAAAVAALANHADAEVQAQVKTLQG